MRCPCRKKRETETYAECCEPYHKGQKPAPTAEALMRSRYTAFALKDAAYLTVTWHRSTRPSRIDFTPDQEWSLLRIVAADEIEDTRLSSLLHAHASAGVSTNSTKFRASSASRAGGSTSTALASDRSHSGPTSQRSSRHGFQAIDYVKLPHDCEQRRVDDAP